MRFLHFILITLLLAGASTVFAQTADQNAGQGEKKQEERKSVLYRWIDGKGNVHITDNLNKVPEKYRQNAKRLETTEKVPEEAVPPREQGVSPYPGYDEEREADLKEEWQGRMKAARQTLADAERRYRELEEKRASVLEKGGSPALGHLEGREEAEIIAQEMKEVQKEIDAARNQIENVIPDAARKAGIPPGWLRE